MSHFYRHENTYESAPHAPRPKRNPFQMPANTSHTSRVSFGKPRTEQFIPESDFSPGKLRGRLDNAQYDSDQSLLEMLNSTVECLKQKNMDLEALGCLEQSLWLKRRMFGVDNSVVHKALNEVMLSYNSVAMQYLAQGQFDQCLAMLRKAEAITAPGNFKRCQALQILTFNNIGCCYRKLGKLKSALKYLKEAAQIGAGSTHVKNLSITHLNLCAIQSQLGRHDLALEHAQAAIFHTQEELVSLEDGGADERDEDEERGDDRDQSALVDVLDAKTREEKIIALAVAYHNLAVELEFNRRGEASLQWYKKALQLVLKYRDTNVALCESFKKIFLDAKKKQKTVNVRQNGICAFSNTGDKSSGVRRPITRPRSAHASSRYMNDTDVSYSSTVASQCYKAIKPSTAGQRYGSPRRATTTRGGKYQRPASATTRQRPQSAKPSTHLNNLEASRVSRDSTEDLLESHWKKLEEEYALGDFQAAQSTKAERKIQRPQSAGGAIARARRQKQTTTDTLRRERLQGQICFAGRDDDIIGNDEDYGVILYEGDSEDGFDDYAGAMPSDRRNNQSEREVNYFALRRIPSGRACGAKENCLGAAGTHRHRRVLNDTRSHVSQEQGEVNVDSDVTSVTQGPEENSPSTSHTGYNGDDDADTDLELPAQRVCHMEYLRRMKKLAESIKDDLNGVGICAPVVKPVQLAASYSKRQAEGSDGCSPKVYTSRSATSKVRDRLEQARRDSLGSLLEAESNNNMTDEIRPAVSTTNQQSCGDDTGIDIQDDCYVFVSEAETRDAEQELFRAAASRRLQAFFRGQRCRTEVQQLKQVKHENDSANLIQRQVRQYLLALAELRHQEEEKDQLGIQREEVEDMAACLIQRLYHRKTSTKAEKDKEKEVRQSSAPRIFSIADIVLGAAVSISAGSEHLPPLNSAATVPRMNLSHPPEQETPRRSCTVSSIPLANTELLAHEDVEPTLQSNRTGREEVEKPRHKSTDATPPDRDSSVEEEHTRQPIAATRIQALVKGYAIRSCVAREHAGQLSRMYIERKHFNVALDHALELEPAFLEEFSAIKIQALVRGQQSRLMTECIRAGVNTAVITIQKSFRIHRQATQQAVEEGVRSIAARTIQQVYREYGERIAAIHQTAVDKEVLAVQEIAATTIQNFWRQNFAAHDHRLEELEAATCIQALGRGHLTRKSLKSLNGLSSESGLSKPSSAFSISSSAEKITEDDDSGSDRHLSINSSFLPRSIRELYVSSSQIQVQRGSDRINALEIVELGLTFADFVQEFADCTDEIVASSALDAMRILVESSPEASRTLANVVKVAQILDRRLHDGFWNEAIEASSIALLQAFRDVLDAH